jgi:hypothetical protein
MNIQVQEELPCILLLDLNEGTHFSHQIGAKVNQNLPPPKLGLKLSSYLLPEKMFPHSQFHRLV